jgi:hypothetical protein
MQYFQMKHVNDVAVGEAIFFKGKYRTVGKKDIKRNSFMGRSIFGDSFSSGHKLVKVLKFCNDWEQQQ